MSAWGCPHEQDGKCARVNDVPCNPGMKGCVLFGRFVWADESKNRPGVAGWGSEPPPDIKPDGHGNNAAPDNENHHARFPLPTPLPQAGEGANESLREFHIKDGD